MNFLTRGAAGASSSRRGRLATDAQYDIDQIAVANFLFRVGLGHGHAIALGQFRVGRIVAEFRQARTERVATGMLAQDELARRNSDFFGHDDLVGQRIFQNAVLMDACFVRKSIGANHGFIGRNADSGDLRKQPACGIELFEIDVRLDLVMILAHVQSDDELLDRSVASAFANAVDRTLNLANAPFNSGERIRDSKAEIIVAVGAEHRFRMPDTRANGAKHLRVFGRGGIANRVRQIDDRGARFNRGKNDFAKEVDIRAAGVFGGELHFLAMRLAETNHLDDAVEGFLARGAQLVFQVQIRGGEKKMQAGLRGGFESFERGIDIGLYRSGEGRYTAALDFRRYSARRIQIAWRSDGETGLDDVGTEFLDLVREPELFLAIHGKARRLFAIAQRGIENLHGIHSPSLLNDTSEPRSATRVQFIIVARRINQSYILARRGFAMDLASLQVFQTAVRERSFSRAAEKLYRTQPAVSISIRKLENWVGQPLFVRGSGAKMLTDAGLLLSEYADRMLNLREEIRKGMQQLRGLERGQLSIGVNESSIHALLPALDRYRRMHPGIQVHVHRVFSRDVPREVLNHQLDIGVISYLPEERELTATEFYRDSLVLVVWPGHRLAKLKDVDIGELGQEQFIAHIVASPYRQRVVQMFARHRVPLQMAIELPTIESIKRCVEMKRGIAIVPRMCAEREIARGDLRELRIRQMRVVRKLYLVYRQDRPLTAAAQELVEMMKKKPTRKTATSSA